MATPTTVTESEPVSLLGWAHERTCGSFLLGSGKRSALAARTGGGVGRRDGGFVVVVADGPGVR